MLTVYKIMPGTKCAKCGILWVDWWGLVESVFAGVRYVGVGFCWVGVAC